MIHKAQYPLEIHPLEYILNYYRIHISTCHRKKTDRQKELVYSVLLLGIVFVQKKKAHSSKRGIYFDLNIYVHRKREQI